MKRILLFSILAFILSSILILNIYPSQLNQVKKINIVLKAPDNVTSDIEMLLIDGMGYLPLRRISGVLKGDVLWNSETKCASWILNNSKIDFTMESCWVEVDGSKKKMNKSPRIIEDTIWIPLEFLITKSFSDSFGKKANWDYPGRVLDVSGGEVEYTEVDDDGLNELTEDVSETCPAKVRYFTHPEKTRFVIELIEKMDFKDRNIEDENSIEIFVQNSNLSLEGLPLEIGDDVIKEIEAEKQEDGYRIFIQLDKEAGGYKSYFLPSPPRIVLDVERITKKYTKTEKRRRDRSHVVIIDKGKKARVRTIVIDPGHGGRDPGAIGRGGLKEKHVVLDVSKRLARLLKKRLNVKVILTRTRDVFIPLENRTKIANKHKADLFVSIHANASLKRKTAGFEIYWLSKEASDAEAQAVANMENSVINLEARVRNEPELYSILWDMTLNEYMNESSELCCFVAREVDRKPVIPNRGVKQAGFFVLRGAMMPSVLVEIGFISNAREERKLRSPGFRQDMAEIIYRGVLRYKKWIERQG